ncbi:hypothetical protein BKA93DRAFT_765154 [Sparassis latifolia]
MASDFDVLSHFLPLDELIQVIYQGPSRFVVLSSVNEVGWTVYVGLSGPEGRWWSGRWTEKDVHKTVGTRSSSKLLETFTEHLTDKFIQGELYIGNWSFEKGAEINLTIGPNAKTPIHIPLAELSPGDAASFATKVFTDIARQAQSRKCRLHPSSYDPPAPPASKSAQASSSKSTVELSKAEAEIKQLKAELADARRSRTPPASTSTGTKKAVKRPHSPAAEKEINKLKAQLARTESEQSMPDTSKLVSIAKGARGRAAAVPPKGASLANPSRKRRKYQALEFGSDED